MANKVRSATVKPALGMVSYLGQHLRGVDHGRIILPSEWRTDDSAKDFMIVAWPVTAREFLLVLPPARWEMLQKNLEDLLLSDEQAALIERLISSNTYPRSVDSYGRLPLPEEAAKALGIENEAMLVGRMNKFEVWGPDRFAASLAKSDTQSIENVIKSIRI